MQYKDLILKFLERGYRVERFTQLPRRKKALILRHDVDFDVDYAYQMSLIEDEIQITSSYFFLLHSESYNLLSKKHIQQIKSMRERGHVVSIHFDPTLYQDVEQGLEQEKILFETTFDVKVQYVSIHRPSAFFLNNANSICGVQHTYQPQYFKNIKYFADSKGAFLHGHPLDSKEWHNGDTIQLLIHPVWWITEGNSPVSKLEELLEFRISSFKKHMASNCKPYKQYIEEKS